MLFLREPKVILVLFGFFKVGVFVLVVVGRVVVGGRVEVVGAEICPEPEMSKMDGSGNPDSSQMKR